MQGISNREKATENTLKVRTVECPWKCNKFNFLYSEAAREVKAFHQIFAIAPLADKTQPNNLTQQMFVALISRETDFLLV